MKAAGTVKFCKVVKPGLGFVEFTQDAEAQNAINMLNGSLMGGQVIEVDAWTGRRPDEKGAKGNGKGGGDFGKMMSMMGGGGGSTMDMMQMMMKMMTGGGGNFGGKGGGKDQRSYTAKPVDESGGVLGEYTGTIKSFSERTFYGFIECPEIKSSGYQDVFLYGDQKKGYRVGHTVKFTAVLNKEGNPVAKDLKSGLK